MKIDAIDVFHLALPLKAPLPSPAGTLATLETVLVRMTGGGQSGWGEANPGNAPLSGPEWTAASFACLRDWLLPAVAGRTIDTAAALNEQLKPFRGSRFAKAALDMAWWDLKARLEGKPLHQLLGGTRGAIELGVSFDRRDSVDEFLAAVRGAFEEGFTRVELKLRPGWEVNMLNAIRHELPVETLHADLEGALRLDHMEMLCRMDDFSLAMVEQPIAPDDFVGHAMIQETIRTPVSLDESITTLEQAEMALDLHSAKYMNVRPGRVGGLTSAVAIHDACHNSCVAAYVGAAPQTAIGSRAGYALAAKENFSYPADYIDSAALLGTDVAEPLRPVRDPAEGKLRITLWTEPGIGVEPSLELVEKYTIGRAGQ